MGRIGRYILISFLLVSRALFGLFIIPRVPVTMPGSGGQCYDGKIVYPSEHFSDVYVQYRRYWYSSVKTEPLPYAQALRLRLLIGEPNQLWVVGGDPQFETSSYVATPDPTPPMVALRQNGPPGIYMNFSSTQVDTLSMVKPVDGWQGTKRRAIIWTETLTARLKAAQNTTWLRLSGSSSLPVQVVRFDPRSNIASVILYPDLLRYLNGEVQGLLVYQVYGAALFFSNSEHPFQDPAIPRNLVELATYYETHRLNSFRLRGWSDVGFEVHKLFLAGKVRAKNFEIAVDSEDPAQRLSILNHSLYLPPLGCSRAVCEPLVMYFDVI